MVRVGYKQTEVGVIPEDWEVKSIGEFDPFVTSGSRGWAEFYSEYGHPFIRITNLSKASIYLDMSDIKYVSLPTKSAEGKRTKLENGDILVSITADIGIIGYITETLPVPSYINQHISLIRFDKNEVHKKYIAYFLTTKKVQQIFRGNTDQGAKAGINLNNIRSIKFAIPSLKEQTAIATALSDIDALITTLTKLIDKKRQIKIATMQQLLTGKQRLAGFGEGKGMKQTELGEIPEDWEVKVIGSLLSITTGNKNTQDNIEDGLYPFFVRSQKIEKINSYSFDGEGVLTAGDGVGTGKIFHHIKGKFDFHQRVYLIYNFNERIHGYYFYIYFSNNFLNRIMSMTAKSSVDSVRREMISNMLIIVPPIQEQQAIAQVLSDMDDDLNALETRLAKTKAIKQGMMQELLTGRTRLI